MNYFFKYPTPHPYPITDSKTDQMCKDDRND